DSGSTAPIGVARVDITPSYPVRLSGYANRKNEVAEIEQRLFAKALAIGDDATGPLVLLSVENCGVQSNVAEVVARRLEEKAHVPRERIAICSTHTHSAPALGGTLNIQFGAPLPPDQQEHIDRYTKELTDNLEKVALAALADRRPGRLAWGQG